MSIISRSRNILDTLQENPLMTIAEMAKNVNKTVLWVKRMLSLNKIKDPEIHKLIDHEVIGINAAFSLASIPESFHSEYADMARTMNQLDFIEEVNRFKEGEPKTPIEEYLCL